VLPDRTAHDLNPHLRPRTSALPPRTVTLLTTPTVLSCHIYPGITGALLSAQLAALPECRAVILSGYGSGNLPIGERSGVLQALKGAVEREILVVVISQCESADLALAWKQERDRNGL
jgi:lysophospholipase